MKMKSTKIKKDKPALTAKAPVQLEAGGTRAENIFPTGKVKEEKKPNWKIILILSLFVIPFFFYFWFGFQHLAQFETADEHLWISDIYTGRIQQYWNAIYQKNWPATRINDKPGVTLALISGIGMRWENNVRSKIVEKQNLWTIYNPDKTQEVYYYYRLPIVICNGLMSLFFFLALLRLTRKHWLALAGASFILLSPMLIGISQIINPDAVLWVFSFAGLLSFMLFLQKSKWWIAIVDGLLAAIFLGLALLSKYVALIFIPFFLVILLWHILDGYASLMEQNGFRKRIFKTTTGYPLIIAGAIGLFALLMPAAIVKPQILYRSILQFRGMQNILAICLYVDAILLLDAVILKSFIAKFIAKHLQFLKIILPKVFYFAITILFALAIANWASGKNFLHNPFFEGYKDDDILLRKLPFYMQIISQSRSLLFSLAPIALLLMFFLWIKSLFRKSELDYLVFILSLFIIVYFYAVTKQNLLAEPRYLIVLYPVSLTLAGIGFYELIKGMKYQYVSILYLLMIGALVSSISSIKPFYFNYTNDLLPKNLTIATSWGYGGYEAVQYISAQGDAKNMKIYSAYYGVCQFFPGKCVMEGQVKWMNDTSVNNIDYVVTTPDGTKKNDSALDSINRVFPLNKPVWELDIDGRPGNFIRVYKNPNKN